MKILVLNCGSSSLKYQLFNMEDESVLAKGICERIGTEKAQLVHQKEGHDKVKSLHEMPDHTVAVKLVIDALLDKETGVIADINEISAVGHRVVHAGKYYSDSKIVNEDVKKVIKDCFELGPLHNPANLSGIEACEAIMENIPQIAVFDTAFHQTMPEKAYMYAIPRRYYDKYNVRRYGFHGTSHSFVSKEACVYGELDINNSKLVICHLGNGSSVSAVLNGKCVDTSMGLTPLEGLIMGTRSGDIDPSIVQFIANKENKTINEIMDVLNKESGVLALSGFSSDFRDLNDAMDAGDQKAKLALDAFNYKVAKTIGSYVTAMNGVDAIVFTAGVGENDHYVREGVCSYFGYLGLEFDASKNQVRGQYRVLSTPESKVKVMIIPTNEELKIAQETLALVK